MGQDGLYIIISKNKSNIILLSNNKMNNLYNGKYILTQIEINYLSSSIGDEGPQI